MSISVKNFGPYSVKNVKSFEGREGLGFNCNLYRDDKKIGSCIDDASGGGMYPIDWDRKLDYKKEQELFDTHIKSLPDVKSDIGGKLFTYKMDEWGFVEELVANFEANRDLLKMQKQCRAKTLFRTSQHKKGQYVIINTPCTDGLRSKLKHKHGDDIEIFNDVIANGEVPSVLQV